MEFLAQNYLWLLIGGIIILMAVIGYIAEKTNFGRGNVPKKKNTKSLKNTEEPVLDKSGIISDIPEITDETVNEGPEDIKLPEIELQPLESFDSDPSDDSENDSDLSEDLMEPLVNEVEEVDEDLMTPLNNEKEPEFENVQEVDEDLMAPFGDNKQAVEEVTLDQPLEVVELEKDAVGTIENNEETEEDEVWKF